MTTQRRAWLVASLGFVVLAVVLFLAHHDFGAVTALIAGFLAVAASKRAT